MKELQAQLQAATGLDELTLRHDAVLQVPGSTVGSIAGRFRGGLGHCTGETWAVTHSVALIVWRCFPCPAPSCSQARDGALKSIAKECQLLEAKLDDVTEVRITGGRAHRAPRVSISNEGPGTLCGGSARAWASRHFGR